jgi:hypothetical protein
MGGNVLGTGIKADQPSPYTPYADEPLNRSKEDWHRQFLSGTTVFVQKTVPMETVCALNYRT